MPDIRAWVYRLKILLLKSEPFTLSISGDFYERQFDEKYNLAKKMKKSTICWNIWNCV